MWLVLGWLVLAVPECRVDPWVRRSGVGRNFTPYVASQTKQAFIKGSTALVFIHVSKCAGTTVKRALAVAARRSGLDPPFTLFRKTWPRFLDACARHGRDCERDLYVGTNTFGACDLIRKKTCTYVTVLRDPIQRLASSWRYFCVKGAENKKGWVNGKCLSLVEWARLQRATMTLDLSTHQAPVVKMNASDCPLLADGPAAADREAHLAAALRNVGPTGAVYAIVAERLASGLRSLERSLGLPLDADNAAAVVANANTDASVVAHADDLRTILRVDLALYTFVLKAL